MPSVQNCRILSREIFRVNIHSGAGFTHDCFSPDNKTQFYPPQHFPLYSTLNAKKLLSLQNQLASAKNTYAKMINIRNYSLWNHYLPENSLFPNDNHGEIRSGLSTYASDVNSSLNANLWQRTSFSAAGWLKYLTIEILHMVKIIVKSYMPNDESLSLATTSVREGMGAFGKSAESYRILEIGISTTLNPRFSGCPIKTQLCVFYEVYKPQFCSENFDFGQDRQIAHSLFLSLIIINSFYCNEHAFWQLLPPPPWAPSLLASS